MRPPADDKPFLQTLGVQKDTHKHQVQSTQATCSTNICLRETGCKDGRWMELAQDRVIEGFRTNGVKLCVLVKVGCEGYELGSTGSG
jgi:hypothetical protein